MAPEVGLEPTTSRLTAARSTIELLWIPKSSVQCCESPLRHPKRTRNLQTDLPHVKFNPPILHLFPHVTIPESRPPRLVFPPRLDEHAITLTKKEGNKPHGNCDRRKNAS